MMVDSPTVALRAGGATAAFGLGRHVWLTEVTSDASDAVTELDVPFGADVIALDPSSDSIVIASGGDVSLLRHSELVATRAVPGRVMLAEVTADGTVALITRSDDAGTRLVVLHGADLALGADPAPLGTWSAHILTLDSDRSAIVAGVAGPRGWEGQGEPYLRRVTWNRGDMAVDWRGDGLPADVRWLRVAAGHLAAAHRDTLITTSVRSLVEHAVLDGPATTLPHRIASLGMSAGGTQLCCNSGGHLWSATFEAPGALADRGACAGDASLSIDDLGGVAAIWLESSVEAVIARAEPGAPLHEVRRITFPRSVFGKS